MPNFFINVKEKGAKKASNNMNALTGSMKKLALQAVSVTAVVQGVKKSIEMSAELQGVRKGFDNLAKSSGFTTAAFGKFKKATDGTINSLSLMKQANNAMLLGITDSEDQMANMFDVAQRLGQSLGLDTVSAVESLVTGLGRQSKLMLDNLGIMVDTNKAYEDHAKAIGKSVGQLTDQERKTAFVNAAMNEANSLVAKLGEEQLTTRDRISRTVVAFDELATTLGDNMAPAVDKIANKFTDLLKSINKVAFAQGALNSATINAVDDQNLLAFAAIEVENEMHQLFDITKSSNKEFRGMGEATEQEKEKMAGLTIELELLNERINDLNMLMVEGAGIPHKLTEQVEASIKASKTKTSWDDKFFKNKLKWQKIIEEDERKKAFMSSQTAIGGMKKVVKAETMEGISGLVSSILKNVPYPFNLILAAGAGGAVSQLIDKNLASFATGGDFVTDGKQLIMVGDNPSGRERVQITPLGGDPNLYGPQGGGITLNISGNVLTEEFTENTIIPQIKEGLRLGGDLGI